MAKLFLPFLKHFAIDLFVWIWYDLDEDAQPNR